MVFDFPHHLKIEKCGDLYLLKEHYGCKKNMTPSLLDHQGQPSNSS